MTLEDLAWKKINPNLEKKNSIFGRWDSEQRFCFYLVSYFPFYFCLLIQWTRSISNCRTHRTLILPRLAWKGGIRREGSLSRNRAPKCGHTWIWQPQPSWQGWQMEGPSPPVSWELPRDTPGHSGKRRTQEHCHLCNFGFPIICLPSQITHPAQTTLPRSYEEPDFFSKRYYDHIQDWSPSQNLYKATRAFTQMLPTSPKVSGGLWGLLSNSPSQKSPGLDVTISRWPYIHLTVLPILQHLSLAPYPQLPATLPFPEKGKETRQVTLFPPQDLF